MWNGASHGPHKRNCLDPVFICLLVTAQASSLLLFSAVRSFLKLLKHVIYFRRGLLCVSPSEFPCFSRDLSLGLLSPCLTLDPLHSIMVEAAGSATGEPAYNMDQKPCRESCIVLNMYTKIHISLEFGSAHVKVK